MAGLFVCVLMSTFLLSRSSALEKPAVDVVPLKLFVSTEGNDEWSGLLPRPNPAGSDGPVATVLQAALLSKKYTSVAVTVVIESGTYPLTSTLSLDQSYRRSPEAPLTFSGCAGNGTAARRPDPATFPVLTGSVSITNHTRLNDGNYIMYVPASHGGMNITQVFVNGQREPCARKPNAGYLYWKSPLQPCASSLSELDPQTRDRVDWRAVAGQLPCPDIDRYGFVFDAGDISSAWTNVDEAWINVFAAWDATWHHIKSIDFDKHTVMFKEPSNYAIGMFEAPSGRRYFVENVLEELDAPGEWYYNRSQGYIIYRPRENRTERLDVAVPVLQNVVSLSGVQHVHFECLTLEHSLEGPDDRQAYHTAEAAVQIAACSDVSVGRCDIRHSGSSCVFIGQASQRIVVDSSRTTDCGGDGISVHESSADVLISNNLVNTTGFVYMMQPTGIRVQGVKNITVEHNEVWNVPYAAIMVGWQAGYPWAAPGSPDRYVFTVRYNRVHDYGLGVLNDFGGVYVSALVDCWQLPPGTAKRPSCNMAASVERNVMHAARCFQYGADGFYSDEAAAGVDVASNVVYDVDSTGVYFHCGVNLTATNNFVVDADVDGHRGALGACNDGGFSKPVPIHFSFERNIVYAAGASSHAVCDHMWVDNSTFDHNIYFSRSAKLSFPNHTTFQEWQASGHDQGSRIEDPGFVSVEKRDFRLQPNSPAHAMGIKPIDLQSVGPQGNPFATASLPSSWTPLLPLQTNTRPSKDLSPTDHRGHRPKTKSK